ncbi:MAG: energy-coupling factor ABC transporter ATP-binding protein [Oscillospiraceae bacterium]|nr:energy-coupling factor ABC transporter ATP-binding protein [Oscillospiraceae bacterium]
MIIQTQNLCFSYPNFALRDINFALHAGELLAITGANGSGKTTLGKLLCGLLKPESGTVLIQGKNTKNWRLGQFGQHVGYLFQEPARQIFAPTVLQELTFTQELRGVPQEESHARAHELLARFELTHLAEQSTLTLSRGEQQRLALCGLLLNQPAALILDEPTTGLDPRRCDILAQTLQACLRADVAILLISHDMTFVQANATRILRMTEGQLHES